MFERCSFWVSGQPRPKGSYKILPKGGASIMRRGKDAYYRIRDLWVAPNNAHLEVWVKAIQAAALEHKPASPLDGPFTVTPTFYFDKPQVPRHQERVLVAPDADKLLRALGDALEMVFWQNDAQVEWGPVTKRYCDPTKGPGLQLDIEYFGQQMSLL
jgi:Holliday junction resolvase RusA-like endonuclease